ncbi:MAG: hypothetical protein LUH15_14025 [Tannerellaceae bacterium]|nr:hypothetical protein [Tannerellaceae bacterium]
MKKIINIIVALLALVSFNSCETYGDYETEYSSIYPMSGEWVVNVTDQSGTDLLGGKIELNTYNTANEDTDKMWVRISGRTAGAYNMTVKANCNLGDLTFSGTNLENLTGNVATSNTTVTISNGKITLQGANTPSGGKADKIEFTFTNSLYPGETFTVSGYRFTGWEEDWD